MTAPVRPSLARCPGARQTDQSRAQVAERIEESRQALARSFDCLVALAAVRHSPGPPV